MKTIISDSNGVREELTVETFNYPNLSAGYQPSTRGSGRLAKGQKVKPGSVLGKISATGELVLVDKYRSDSARDVYAISADYEDTTAESKIISVDLSGEFNTHHLEFAIGNTADDHEYSARLVGIIFRTSLNTDNKF